MITVRIGEEERSLQAATEQWITQQIQRRRADGHSICGAYLSGGEDST